MSLSPFVDFWLPTQSANRATCKKLESNWYAGWAYEPLEAAMLIHGIKYFDIKAFCGSEFVCWWFIAEFDVIETSPLSLDSGSQAAIIC